MAITTRQKQNGQAEQLCRIIGHQQESFIILGLKGFGSGMFISKIAEAGDSGLQGITEVMIDESNLVFCNSLAKDITEDTVTI
jgi:hypothetical protein